MTNESENHFATRLGLMFTHNLTIDPVSIASNTTEGASLDGTSYREWPMRIAIPVVFAVIFVVGLIGNTSVIYIVLKHRKMRNAPNIFIANLSVADLLLIVLSVPIASTVFTLDSWPFGESLCKLSYFMKTLTVGVSVFTLTALSADRMLAIAFSMSKYNNEAKKKRICITLISIWLVSIGLATPDAVAYHVIVYEDGNEGCEPYPSSWEECHYDKINVVQHFLLYYAIPLIVISVCYGVTARVMVKSSVGLPGERIKMAATGVDKQMRARKKVANMVVMLVVLFFICWLPRRIFLLWFHLSNDVFTDFWVYFRVIGYCLSFCTSFVNPISLYFVSKQFRRHYRHDILCRSKVLTNQNALSLVSSRMTCASCRSDSHAVQYCGTHTQITGTLNGSVHSTHSLSNNNGSVKCAGTKTIKDGTHVEVRPPV